MSDINLEAISEDSDPSRTSQNPVAANPTKKRSGFQITSVKDSDHGRPASMVHDEESADDLDESHASYSDVSYSRTTDADVDHESSASEDTLNTSVQETVQTDLNNHINHQLKVQHANHQTPQKGVQDDGAKLQKPSDSSHDPAKLQHSAVSIPKTPLKKQASEQLDSPQELPLDSLPGDSSKEIKSNGSEKKAHLPQSSGASIKVTTPSASPDQSALAKATVSSSTATNNTTASQQPRINSPESAGSSGSSEKTIAPCAGTAPAHGAKAASVSSSAQGGKAPGTRVYKVVKRENAQPTKRTRERWCWYDFSDTQSPVTGISSQNVSTDRQVSNHSLSALTYTNTLFSGVDHRYQSASFLNDQLMKAADFAGTASSTRSNKSVMNDALKSAISSYAAGTSGDAATGDTSVEARTQKIDNKIEAAMDLVKKHLMSAVRDEVDELKEKIKELDETIANLTSETNRLKAENKELRSKLPVEALSQVKPNHSPPKNSPSSESLSTTSSTVDALSQKGTSASIGQDAGGTHLDAQKTSATKTASVTSHTSHATPTHMQKTAVPNSQPGHEPHMQDHEKSNQRTADHNFERKSPS